MRPRIGSPCAKPDVTCFYDDCGNKGFNFRCDSSGYWTDAISACGGA
jgi:hypothetical protein